MGKRTILFGCGSVYQLMNAILLARTEFAQDVCDIVLANYTNWDEGQIANIARARIFNRISRFDAMEFNNYFYSLEPVDKGFAYAHPFIDGNPISDRQHDILCFGVNHIPWMMHYHYCVINGHKPEVYMFDEGVRSYTRELSRSESLSYMKGVFGEDTFFKAISRLYLHCPGLYCAPSSHIEVCQIPRVVERQDIREIMFWIFGKGEMPSEKYVYLEDYFFADRITTNDFYLVRTLANIVGKENMIIKRHPRDKHDRFAPFGYKEFPVSVVPWEIQLMAHDYTRKIFVSVTSTSVMTPFIIFDSPIHVVSLEKIFVGEHIACNDSGYKRFIKSFRDMVNKDEVHWYVPQDIEELKSTLVMLERRLNA